MWVTVDFAVTMFASGMCCMSQVKSIANKPGMTPVIRIERFWTTIMTRVIRCWMSREEFVVFALSHDTCYAREEDG